MWLPPYNSGEWAVTIATTTHELWLRAAFKENSSTVNTQRSDGKLITCNVHCLYFNQTMRSRSWFIYLFKIFRKSTLLCITSVMLVAGRSEAGAADVTREAPGAPALSGWADHRHGEERLWERTDPGSSHGGKQSPTSGGSGDHWPLFEFDAGRIIWVWINSNGGYRFSASNKWRRTSLMRGKRKRLTHRKWAGWTRKRSPSPVSLTFSSFTYSSSVHFYLPYL